MIEKLFKAKGLTFQAPKLFSLSSTHYIHISKNSDRKRLLPKFKEKIIPMLDIHSFIPCIKLDPHLLHPQLLNQLQILIETLDHVLQFVFNDDDDDT
jgi:hypothetical protein